MKHIKLPLFAKVLVAIALGVGLGFVLPEVGIRILKTFNVLFSQLLKFIIPLMVLGLVTPAISSLGRGAGKMLGTVVVIAYGSTICAGLFAYLLGVNLLPFYISFGEISMDSEVTKFLPYIDIKIPPLCDIMTALVLSFMIGIGIVFTQSDTIRKCFDDFGNIVKLTIEKIIIPLLPVYILTMIAEMTASGQIGNLAGAGLKIILTGVVLSIVYLIIQYIVAGCIVHKNPFKCLWTMLPAYFTAFSICSSSAAIPVTQACTEKNGVSKDIASFTIPLCSTVHMCGSTIKLAISALAVMLIGGMPFSFPVYLHFVLLQGIAAVAAPGVMGGVLMASIGLMESILGFAPEQTALVMALYLAFDGYGPACNVTGDGAIALVIDKFFGQKYQNAEH